MKSAPSVCHCVSERETNSETETEEKGQSLEGRGGRGEGGHDIVWVISFRCDVHRSGSLGSLTLIIQSEIREKEMVDPTVNSK